MYDIDALAKQLAPHYSYFDVTNRLLFTGHSHQAWPDVAREGLLEAYDLAAQQVGHKWDKASQKTAVLRRYLRTYYDDPDGLYCQGQNTHQLLVSWLSSFNLGDKPKVITTNGEFHSMFRQLHRLTEEGLQLTLVDAESEHMVEDIKQEIDEQVAAIMLSRVFFQSGLVNQDIEDIAQLARNHGIPLLIDDYHGTNVVPLSIQKANLEDCFLLMGGYKYLQWGEGNCFLRFPKSCTLRPAITGWFASFDTRSEARNLRPTQYDDGNQRFATGTYEPASQFRAAKVVEFFYEQNLTPTVLQQQYQQQIALLKQQFLAQDFDPALIKLCHQKPLEQNGGFLALQSPHAGTLQKQLLEKEVYTDARGDVLRMGVAPYINTRQIDQATIALKQCIKEISK